jgi:hypothetical protein
MNIRVWGLTGLSISPGQVHSAASFTLCTFRQQVIANPAAADVAAAGSAAAQGKLVGSRRTAHTQCFTVYSSTSAGVLFALCCAECAAQGKLVSSRAQCSTYINHQPC